MSQLTKLALEDALKKNLLKKPLEKITITDLTETCGVSRMTFYYHFADINDLIEWSARHDAEQAIGSNRTYETWQEGFLNLFHEVEKNKPFILNVYASQDMKLVLRYLNTVTLNLLLPVVEEASAGLGMQSNEDDEEFLASFYAHAFVGIMLEWIDGGMKESPEKLTGQLELAIKGAIPLALQRMHQAKAA